MYDYMPQQWLFLFYLFSFLGWCWETLYVSILEKRFVNRGFMRGPILPLYGSGGVMMLMIARPFNDNILLVYIAGCIGATTLELVTGIVMEKLFKVRYWTYSHKKFNFKGYICLESALFWGSVTVLFSNFLQVSFSVLLSFFSLRVIAFIKVIVTAFFGFDFAMAFRTAIELRDVLMYMERAKAEMTKMQKRLNSLIAIKGEEVKEGIGQRLDVLSSSLEKSFNSAKEKISINPSAYVNDVKDEVFELYTKYRIMMEKMTPPPVKSFFDWYRNRTILDTNMDSEEYKASLEELKERTFKDRDRK